MLTPADIVNNLVATLIQNLVTRYGDRFPEPARKVLNQLGFVPDRFEDELRRMLRPVLTQLMADYPIIVDMKLAEPVIAPLLTEAVAVALYEGEQLDAAALRERFEQIAQFEWDLTALERTRALNIDALLSRFLSLLENAIADTATMSDRAVMQHVSRRLARTEGLLLGKLATPLETLNAKIEQLLQLALASAKAEPEDEQKRTVFISYARKDHADEGRDPNSFVQKLARALKDAGFTPWLDHHDLPSRGATFPKELAAAVQEAEYVIAVCGPAYPGSDWAQAERAHAHLHCIAITPVLAAGDFMDSVPDDLNKLNAIDMRGEFEACWPELLKRIQPAAAVPGTLIDAVSAMPQHNPADLPRAALFEQIKRTLRADQTDPIAISGTRALTAMYAAGGIGKTRLAAEIARDCEVRRGFPDGVIWMRVGEAASNPESLRVMLGGYLGLPAEQLQGPQGALTFTEHLKKLDALIILDDIWSAEQVRVCRVDGPNLRYLITTRLANLGSGLGLPPDNRIGLDYLTADEGAALIARRLGLDPETEYPHKAVHRAIGETLGGHTQAIDLAAAQLRPRSEGGSGADYAPRLLEQLQKGDNTLFELLMRSVDDDSREGNLLKSLSVSYDMLPAEPVDLQRCFRRLGAFALGGTFDSAAAAAVWEIDDPERARRWLNDLAGRSLVIPSEEGERYSLHALIHNAARALLTREGERDTARRHFAHYRTAMQQHDDGGTYPRMAADIPQLKQAFAWAAEQEALDLMLSLLGNAANLLRQFGQRRERFGWADACVILAQRSGDPHPLGQAYGSRGSAYSDLATVQGEDRRQRLLQALADYDLALPLRSDVPLAKATTLNNRATVYRDLATVQGEDRRQRLLQALADYDLALPLRSDVPLAKATTLNNRATVYSDLATVQGEDRRQRLLQALADYDLALPLRSDVPLAKATTLNNRATVYRDLATVQGEDRRQRLLQALADYDLALPLRSDVPLAKATTLNNRATVYSDLATVQGEDRRQRLLQALADYDLALPLLSDVPLDKAGTLNNRANVYRDLATVQGEDRRQRLLQALADYDLALPLRSDVPLDKATTLNNRANVYSDLATVQGEDRRQRLLQALADYDLALPLLSDVPLDKATTLNNRANVYSDLATVQGEDRRQRLLQALADYDLALPLRSDVPLDKATTLNNRANVYRDLATVQGEDRRQRLLQALADYDLALPLRSDVPLDKATTLNNRANVYSDLATVQGEDRRQRLLQALADFDLALPLLSDVPLDKATTLNNRATVYSDLATVQGEDRRQRLLQALADYDLALPLRSDVPLAKATTLNNRANVYSDLATVQGEDRRQRLLQALADYDLALPLLSDVPLAKATTLNNRANVYSDLATVQGEDRRQRLLQALADFDLALPLRSDVPLDKATTLNNRATVYRDLATVQGEDRRQRLLQALRDIAEALMIFEAYQHPVYIPVARRVLGTVTQEIVESEGMETLETWWADLTGGQPLPEWLRPGTSPSLTQEEAQRLANLLIGWVQTPDWDASAAYLRQHAADLLSDAAEFVMQMLVQSNPGNQAVEAHLALLRKGRQAGLDALVQALTARSSAASISQEEKQRLANLLIGWVQTPDWDASAAYLRQHAADLLSDAAETVLQMLIQQNPGVEALAQHLAMLRKGRQDGLDALVQALTATESGTLSEETVKQLTGNTVEVKTTEPNKLEEWRAALTEIRADFTGRGDDWHPETAFVDALLALLADQPVALPPDNPYADAVAQATAAIRGHKA